MKRTHQAIDNWLFRFLRILTMPLVELIQITKAIKAILKQILIKMSAIILRQVRQFMMIMYQYKVIKLLQKMHQAKTFEEWVEYAKSLDYLEKKDQWKMINQSRLYDYERIELRYKTLKRLRKQKDVKALA